MIGTRCMCFTFFSTIVFSTSAESLLSMNTSGTPLAIEARTSNASGAAG